MQAGNGRGSSVSELGGGVRGWGKGLIKGYKRGIADGLANGGGRP